MSVSKALPFGTHEAAAGQLSQVVSVIRRIPERVRNKRFWQVQALVLLATATHYGLEIGGFTSPEGAMHDFAITLYIVPLLYAALSFGWEGAVMTGLWGVILTSPSTLIWHHSGWHWLAEASQLAITMFIGILVAWRVDLESKQRQIAERTSASLGLLNQVGESLSHTLEVEQRLPAVLKALQAGLHVDSVALCLEPETGEADPILLQEGPRLTSAAAAIASFREHGLLRTEVVRGDDGTVLVPIVAESGVLGSLVIAGTTSAALREDQIEILSTIAHEIAVGIENARLYRQRQESMQSYVRQVTQAQEDERMRIARELHDDTAQGLVRLVRKLEQLALSGGPAVASQAEEGLAIARDLMQSVRRFSRDLRPSILDDLGLIAAIEMVVQQTDEVLSGGARLQISGHPRRLDPPVELALFRIAQEALRNVTKHARAKTAIVDLCFETEEISLAVSDDGIGFSPPAAVSDLARMGKLGILGMKERAELVGGSLELQGGAARGVRIIAKVKQGSNGWSSTDPVQ